MGKSPEVKFIHLRAIEVGTGGLRVSCRGGLTVAFTPEPEGGYRIATAQCHAKDNFNRKVGRIKAAGRLNSDRQSKVIKADEKDLVVQIDAMANARGLVRQYSKRKTRSNRAAGVTLAE